MTYVNIYQISNTNLINSTAIYSFLAVQIQPNDQTWLIKRRYYSDILKHIKTLDYRVYERKEMERETTRNNRKFCDNGKMIRKSYLKSYCMVFDVQKCVKNVLEINGKLSFAHMLYVKIIYKNIHV